MTIHPKLRAITLFLMLWFVAASSATASTLIVPNGPLVTAEWLRSNHSHSRIVLIDTSPTPVFMKAHIAGAKSQDFYRDGGRTVSTEVMQKRLHSWGVNADSILVLYDAGAEIGSANLFFDLVSRGFPREQLFILDGGLARWQSIGGAVVAVNPNPNTNDAKSQIAGTYQLPQQAKSTFAMKATLSDVFNASTSGDSKVVLDALEAEYYYGGAKYFDRAGHIPHSLNMPSEDFFNEDKTFKSRAELEKMLAHYGVSRSKSVISHCGGGVAATVPWFALRVLLDYPDVSVYRESQREWLRDERQLPFWTYPAPRILREQQWLAGWNHWMLRGAGAAQVNILDVRRAAEYASGHIEFSVSLPADDIRTMLRSTNGQAALRNALGMRGVNAHDEIVIVSGNGITREAALVFYALKSIGHEHVSILRGSLEDWQLAGRVLTKTPTTVGRPTSPKDFVLPPTTYNVAENARTSHPQAKRMYLASGVSIADLPRNTPEGKVVHLSAAQFVDANGNPKPAFEIWTQMQKAGVSRYAEVVTFANDIEDASMNYLVLSLMGFARVSVMPT